jgi:hypothetical protein
MQETGTQSTVLARRSAKHPSQLATHDIALTCRDETLLPQWIEWSPVVWGSAFTADKFVAEFLEWSPFAAGLELPEPPAVGGLRVSGVGRRAGQRGKGLAAGFEPFADYDLATFGRSREPGETTARPGTAHARAASGQQAVRPTSAAKAATAPQLAVGHGRYSASLASARVIRSLLGSVA